MKGILNRLLRPLGYEVMSQRKLGGPDINADSNFSHIYKICKPHTLTSKERMYGLYSAVRYIVERDIPGDFVECGVWKGGSAMVAAMTLKLMGDTQRKLFLYDTYEGMTPPSQKDKDFHGVHANDYLSEMEKKDGEANYWAYASLESVRKNLDLTGVDRDRFVLIKGKVEDTIPGKVPQTISILRLDTDWYESTAHELKYLYPILTMGGILIIDDYGHWQGSREATDEYFSEHPPLLLNRLDYSGRIAIKN